jgi:hypothetical protein
MTTTVTVDLAGALAALTEEVRATRDDLRALSQRFDDKPPGRPRDRDDRRVVEMLAATCERDDPTAPGWRVQTTDVVRLAALETNRTLRRTLIQADATEPRSLGKLFARMDGVAVGEYALARIGENSRGAIWRLSRW